MDYGHHPLRGARLLPSLMVVAGAPMLGHFHSLCAAGGARLGAGLAVALLAGCASPELALRDLKALHEVDQERQSLRLKRTAALYGSMDRLLYESGIGRLLPQADALIAPSARQVSKPEEVVVERLRELRDVDPGNTGLICEAVYWCCYFLDHSPTPLGRARAAEDLVVFARHLPALKPLAKGAGAAAIDQRIADLLGQVRRDFTERTAALARGERLPPEMVARHRQALRALRAVRPPDTYGAKRLVEVLPLFLARERSPELAGELESTCRTLAAHAVELHLRRAVQRRDPNDFARAEIAAAWFELRGAAGVGVLLAACGRDSSEVVRRRIIGLVAGLSREEARSSGALDWLVGCSGDEERLSSGLARRALGRITGLKLRFASDWQEALRREETSATPSGDASDG